MKFSRTLTTPDASYLYYSLDSLAADSHTQIHSLPFSIRILIENALRNYDGNKVTEEHIQNLSLWQPTTVNPRPAVPFYPGRVLMQDLTGVPVIVDLAAMRSAAARLGQDARKINPVIPVDLVVDHSLQVDYYGSADAFQRNTQLEFQRNQERYTLLKWAQSNLNNFRVIPPASGICHQVNLEYLAQVVLTRNEYGHRVAFPDTVIGTDSHTTMINGLGVLGWGEGGIEATSIMLGEPLSLSIPDVIGFKLSGQLPSGTTPTDLTLTIVQILRKKGVVGKFVEFFGSGLASLPLPDRAMIANMTPEIGNTATFFPVDEQTLTYMRQTARPADLIDLVETYCKTQHLFRSEDTPDPQYTAVIELDLSTIEPCLAGPKRPQDRVPLTQVKNNFRRLLPLPKNENGFALKVEDTNKTVQIQVNQTQTELRHGSILLAAITSCTNTSNPFVMISAGLVAKKALEKGLKVKPYVKTSLAPGSRVVETYLKECGLLPSLDNLGFNIIGYGCTTCIGNSGPLVDGVAEAIQANNLVGVAVLSGNRNFEGRVHPHAAANYLASPPLVIAYALAGSIDINFDLEPLGTGKDGNPVFLKDIWFTPEEVEHLINTCVSPKQFINGYANLSEKNELWNSISDSSSQLYTWDPASTYLQEPPYFDIFTLQPSPIQDIQAARVLAVLSDSITTDHISPAGSIPVNSPAGKFLLEHGVNKTEFNTYGTRRGNDKLMVRGTLANIRLKNQLVPGVEGGYTLYLPDKKQMTIYDAAQKYKEKQVPLIILAGKEYGTGSSRDWAAKGVLLLGVKAVIAESFERIHRTNLLGMGVLPLQFTPGEGIKTLGITGYEQFSFTNLQNMMPGNILRVHALREDGSHLEFNVILRLDSPHEIDCFRQGGILHQILRRFTA